MFLVSRRICILLMRLAHHLKKYFIHSTNNYWVPVTCIMLCKVLACINKKALPTRHLLSKIKFTKLKFNIFYLLVIACIYPNYIIRCNHPENKRETEFYFKKALKAQDKKKKKKTSMLAKCQKPKFKTKLPMSKGANKSLCLAVKRIGNHRVHREKSP